MKSDLERLMAERGYAALLVLGGAAHNAPMYYLANGAAVTERTVLVHPRGGAPILYVSAMERDEAARSGLEVRSALPRLRELGAAKGLSEVAANARWLGELLAASGVPHGTVAAYGQTDLGAGHALLTALAELCPQYNVVGEFDHSLLQQAMLTKDAAEVKRIRAVGAKTLRVVADTEAFLTRHRAKKGVLVKKDGAPLTVGDVKQHIRSRLQAENLVDPGNGTIFAIGRDAGVPHSRGRDADPMALGQTIIYDIFPAEPGGGYYFDFTRTWCLGDPSPEVARAYADVLAAFQTVMRALTPGALCRDYQHLACDVLEARGHPTLRTDPRGVEGYVHSLAHGVGLNLHEAPSFAGAPTNTDRLEPGMVVTIEPGVYYPERGYGLRLEDCVWLNPATLKFETLGRYHKRLALHGPNW